jgi:Protoheme ferro-lyase (ferrochelatase)
VAARLNGVILPIRPRRKARDYKKIWNEEQNESPLKTITRAQAEKLGAMLAPRGPNLVVDWAMRYGNPSIASRLADLAARGCERILVIPLYPQYCAATTATVGDEVFRVLERMRFQPALRIAPPYYDDDAYIEALASTTDAAIAGLDLKPDVILRRSTACRRPMSTRAIPITPNASRPCGCCARGSVSTRRNCCSRSNRASAARSGSSPRPTGPCVSSPRRA